MIFDAGSDYSPEGTFRDWKGGTIVQFHKSWGALVAYDDEAELPTVQKAAAMIEAALTEAVAIELSALEDNA
jgi:hypothetical protein